MAWISIKFASLEGVVYKKDFKIMFTNLKHTHSMRKQDSGARGIEKE